MFDLLVFRLWCGHVGLNGAFGFNAVVTCFSPMLWSSGLNGVADLSPLSLAWLVFWLWCTTELSFYCNTAAYLDTSLAMDVLGRMGRLDFAVATFFFSLVMHIWVDWGYWFSPLSLVWLQKFGVFILMLYRFLSIVLSGFAVKEKCILLILI